MSNIKILLNGQIDDYEVRSLHTGNTAEENNARSSHCEIISITLCGAMVLVPRHILDVKKKQIENNLFELFTQVRRSIENAIGCLEGKDKTVCQNVVDNDPQINEARRLLEQDCLLAIASQQPVAHDLRDIVACMRVATELERIADYASDIAVSVMQMDGHDIARVGLDAVKTMSGSSGCGLMVTISANSAI